MKTCSYCGRQAEDHVTQCSGCGTEFEDVVPLVEKLTKAGFWIRAGARILDSLFCICLAFLAGMIGAVLLQFLNKAGLLQPGWSLHLRGFSLVNFAFAFVASIAYHFFCEGVHGATLGKLCCGICVVQQDGKASRLSGALIRSVAYYWDSLFLGAVGYTSMDKSSLNQRYGDVWGKTAVFKNSEIPAESRRTTEDFIIGLFLGTASYMVLILAGLIIRVL